MNILVPRAEAKKLEHPIFPVKQSWRDSGLEGKHNKPQKSEKWQWLVHFLKILQIFVVGLADSKQNLFVTTSAILLGVTTSNTYFLSNMHNYEWYYQNVKPHKYNLN